MPGSAIDYYSAHAAEFHQSYQHDANRLERMAHWRRLIAEYIPHASLAYDIGCGSGVLTSLLADHADTVIAMDGSAAMLEVAKKTTQGIHSITFEQHTLPLPPAHPLPLADALICSSVLEYLDSPAETLRFFHRILQEGGITIWSISNKDSLSRKLVRFIHTLTGYPPYFGLLKHFMTPEIIAPLLEQAGFSALDIIYTSQADALNRVLSTFLPRRYTSNMIIVVARKT